MSPPRSRRGVAVVVVVVAVVLGLAVSCNGFREEEIACEQAVIHLHDCCPAFNPTAAFSCSYSEQRGCDRTDTYEYPALTLDDSQCIQTKSCSELVSSGACSRAVAAKPRSADADVDSGVEPATPPSAHVCTLAR